MIRQGYLQEATNFLMLCFLAPSTKPIAWLQLEMLMLDHAVAVRVAPVLLPAGLPGQSEVIIWSRDLVLTNHSSPGVPGVPRHGGHVPLQQGPLPLSQGPAVFYSIC